jgi:hypothetical protein
MTRNFFNTDDPESANHDRTTVSKNLALGDTLICHIDLDVKVSTFSAGANNVR